MGIQCFGEVTKIKFSKGSKRILQKILLECEILNQSKEVTPLDTSSCSWGDLCYRILKIGELFKNLDACKRSCLETDYNRIMNCRDMIAHMYSDDIDYYEVIAVRDICINYLLPELNAILVIKGKAV